MMDRRTSGCIYWIQRLIIVVLICAISLFLIIPTWAYYDGLKSGAWDGEFSFPAILLMYLGGAASSSFVYFYYSDLNINKKTREIDFIDKVRVAQRGALIYVIFNIIYFLGLFFGDHSNLLPYLLGGIGIIVVIVIVIVIWRLKN